MALRLCEDERERLGDAVPEEDGDVLRVSRALVDGDPVLRPVPDAADGEDAAEIEASLVAENCTETVVEDDIDDDEEVDGEPVAETEGRLDLLPEADGRADLETELLGVAAADTEEEEWGEVVLVCDGDTLALRRGEVDARGDFDTLELGDTDKDEDADVDIELEAKFDVDNRALKVTGAVRVGIKIVVVGDSETRSFVPDTLAEA